MRIESKGLKRIGRGAFTTAYLATKDKVILKSRCPAKECMSLGWFPNTPLFPKVTRVAHSDTRGYSTYLMKYYPPIQSPKKVLNSKHYRYYQELRKIPTSSKPGELDKMFNRIPNKYLRDTLLQALYALYNYGEDVCFEIPPRNIRATKTGRLILLDVFFFSSKLRY